MATWRPDLLSLRLFVAVCEEASIARAAERESIVPSAISKRIAEIEELTGASLLVRGARGVRPTPAGTALLHHARQIVRSTERLQAELNEYAKGVRGHVRLFANISSIVEFLPRDLSSFLARHPNYRVDLQERVSPMIAEAVRDGTAELGICLAAADMTDLEVVPYGSDRLVLVTHPVHPLADRAVVAFEDTLDHPFVALNPESGTTRLLAGLAARKGRLMDHRIYVSTFEAASHVIAENLAIGILAEDAVKSLAASLGLRVVPLSDEWARRDIVLCMRSRETLAPPASALLDHLTERRDARRASR
jgi:DNA-binding transcriptional LysR family regulator